jgi:hypothetical protein
VAKPEKAGRAEFEWRDQVLNDTALAMPARLLAIYLGTYANWSKGRECWPAIATLANRIGAKPRAVIMWLKQLSDRGHIHIESGKASGKSSTYRCVLFAPAYASPCTPPTHDDAHPLRTATHSPKHNGAHPLRMAVHTNSIKEHQGELLSEFDDFLEAFPRKVAKRDARKAYDKIIKAGTATHSELLAGAQRYAIECRDRESKFIQAPDKWLAKERWTDEPAKPSTGAGAAGSMLFGALDQAKRMENRDDD